MPPRSSSCCVPALGSERLAEEALELTDGLLRDVPLWDYGAQQPGARGNRGLRSTKLNASGSRRCSDWVCRETEVTGFRASLDAGALWRAEPVAAVPVAFRGADFMTRWDEYLKVANGEWPPGIMNHYADLYYLRSGRDVSEYVHWDFCNQAAINAAAILLANPHRPREAWPTSNPYKTSRTMNGFVQFGSGYAQNAMGVVCDLAFKACWQEKWLRHRALRPEEYGALVDRAVRGENTGVHPLIVNSEAVKRVRSKYGSALLPQAYPEGCPPHPAYPSGHATVAGACVTVLKALFDEKRKLRFPLQPTRDGKDWQSLDANLPAPTVGAELNKLATAVAMGRNFAGIHWRSDAWQGLLLGESVATAWLRAEKAKSVEAQQGWLKSFEFTSFAGERVVV
ncbi:MAG: vanadium-dependent haloperoxidase [Burkholderiales bacterium]